LLISRGNPGAFVATPFIFQKSVHVHFREGLEYAAAVDWGVMEGARNSLRGRFLDDVVTRYACKVPYAPYLQQGQK
jgi:hypothetical protein